jgi:hypothetical protein
MREKVQETMRREDSWKTGGKNTLNSGLYVLPAMPKGSAHTALEPIIVGDK